MNNQVDVTSSNLAPAMLNSKIRPREVVGYGVKIFHPSPPNYVPRSPGFADEPLMVFSIFSNQSTSSLEDRYFTSVLLEPRSLFLLTGDLYHNYLHGIAERTNDVISEHVANLESCKSAIADTLERATRISLTIRNVPKILKFKLNLGR